MLPQQFITDCTDLSFLNGNNFSSVKSDKSVREKHHKIIFTKIQNNFYYAKRLRIVLLPLHRQ
jgi:hypothetical protein